MQVKSAGQSRALFIRSKELVTELSDLEPVMKTLVFGTALFMAKKEELFADPENGHLLVELFKAMPLQAWKEVGNLFKGEKLDIIALYCAVGEAVLEAEKAK